MPLKQTKGVCRSGPYPSPWDLTALSTLPPGMLDGATVKAEARGTSHLLGWPLSKPTAWARCGAIGAVRTVGERVRGAVAVDDSGVGPGNINRDLFEPAGALRGRAPGGRRGVWKRPAHPLRSGVIHSGWDGQQPEGSRSGGG